MVLSNGTEIDPRHTLVCGEQLTNALGGLLLDGKMSTKVEECCLIDTMEDVFDKIDELTKKSAAGEICIGDVVSDLEAEAEIMQKLRFLEPKSGDKIDKAQRWLSEQKLVTLKLAVERALYS